MYQNDQKQFFLALTPPYTLNHFMGYKWFYSILIYKEMRCLKFQVQEMSKSNFGFLNMSFLYIFVKCVHIKFCTRNSRKQNFVTDPPYPLSVQDVALSHFVQLHCALCKKIWSLILAYVGQRSNLASS